MHTWSAPIDRGFQPHSIPRCAAKIPLKILAAVAGILQISKHLLLSFMPQHCFAKDQSKGHLIDQRFQRARRAARPGKICMRPRPEIAMPVSAVMPLHSEPQRISRKGSSIERDLPRKNRVGMWRTREANPALVAQGHAECRAVAQVPGDQMSVQLQAPLAGIFADAVIFNAKVKRIFPSPANV